MVSVKEHYDNLLAPCYSWLCGGIEQGTREYRNFFRAHAVRPTGSGVAADLGAGNGFQSIPLAESGFRVIAIDLSQDLLGELEARAHELPVETIRDDLLHFTGHIPEKIELIVCMGDTLTHIPTLHDVETLLERSSRTLEENGRLILGFRDLTRKVTGLDRFIPVRHDPERIFTCFLEYQGSHVRVNDILYERNADGWVMKKSCFQKLVIPPQWIKACLRNTGFSIVSATDDKGMTTIIARKRPRRAGGHAGLF